MAPPPPGVFYWTKKSVDTTTYRVYIGYMDINTDMDTGTTGDTMDTMADTTARVTIGKAVVTDTTTGETCWTITIGDTEIGYIEKEVAGGPTDAMDTYFASHYTAVLWGDEDTPNRERTFPVQHTRRDWAKGGTYQVPGYPTARKALAAAKAWVRSQPTDPKVW